MNRGVNLTKRVRTPGWRYGRVVLSANGRVKPDLNLEEIERRDLLKFSAFLRDEKEQAPRSVYNKFENEMTFLKAHVIRGLVGKNDWPRYTEEEPEIYEQRGTRPVVRKVRRGGTPLV